MTVYLWALGTWKLLRTEHPLQAKVFFGDAPYGEGHFMVAYPAGINRRGEPYLDRQIKILEYLVSPDVATSAPNVHG